MKKILGIGNALVDVMTVINDDKILGKFGLPKGSMTLVDDVKSNLVKSETKHFNRSQASGGSAANTIHGLAMLGVKTGFIGSVGNDDTGDFFENDMKSAGVKTFLSRRNSVTGTAVALISSDSERTFATHLGAALELEAKDLSSEYFKGFDILYLEGYLIFNKSLVERACFLAKENNMKIAIDLASYNVVDARLEDFKEIIEKYVDIVFSNEDEAKSFTGAITYEALEIIAKSCDVAVVKVGKEGSLIKKGDELIKIGTIDVQSIDTTGAGDLYASGFLYGYAYDYPLDKCGVFGSILAGHVIEVVGARMDKPQWEKIIKLIKESIEKE